MRLILQAILFFTITFSAFVSAPADQVVKDTSPAPLPANFTDAVCTITYAPVGDTAHPQTVSGKIISLAEQGYVHLTMSADPTKDVLIPVGTVIRIDCQKVSQPTAASTSNPQP
jgi:hypothetical protein